jgi:hypothetical protein
VCDPIQEQSINFGPDRVNQCTVQKARPLLQDGGSIVWRRRFLPRLRCVLPHRLFHATGRGLWSSWDERRRSCQEPDCDKGVKNSATKR